MRRLLILTLVILGCSWSAHSQMHRWYNRYAKVVRANALVANYADSLRLLKKRLDAVRSANERAAAESGYVGGDGRYYPLFAPLTFYHDAAAEYLSVGSDDDVVAEVNRSLMRVYLNRPDLVQNSQNRLQQEASTGTEVSAPVKQEVNLVTHVRDSIQTPPVVTPVDVVVKKPNFWTFKGDYYLQLLQNYVSDNWYKGGESNYSMLASVLMEANYNNKQKVKWENKLEMKVGFLTSEADSVHTMKTSEDLLRLTSKLGLQASKKWYYTLQMLAVTQFVRGYKSNDPAVYSDFLSPLTIDLSLGMDYTVEAMNKHLKGTIHFAPLAYKFHYVDRLALAPTFGLKEGHHTLHDLGSLVTADLTWTFTDNIKWQTRFYAFTTYKGVTMEWENTFSFKFNKYISTNLFAYPRFDDTVSPDAHHGYWQFKEFASIGFTYSF